MDHSSRIFVRFDTGPPVEHPTGVLKFSRRLAAVAAVMVLSIGNLVACAGWEPSPDARMACCADEDTCPMHRAQAHHSTSKRNVSQAEADNCCASSERHETAPAGTAFVLQGVLAIAPNDILGALIKDGSIASSQSSTHDLLRRTRDVVIAQIVNSVPTRGLVPSVGTVVMPTDVWGNALTYVRNTPDLCSVGAGASAFTLTSYGPNKIPDVTPPTPVNDDVVVVQSTASLQTTIFNLGTPCP